MCLGTLVIAVILNCPLNQFLLPSQVRKLCRDCKKVLDYLAISEVSETVADLVQYSAV